MSVDPTTLDTEPPHTVPDGIFTAEEVWNEIGGPVEDNPNAQSYTPIETIEATIHRVLRGYEDQALATIEQSNAPDQWAHLAERSDLDVEDGSGSTMDVGEVTIPVESLPYFFGKVLAEDGTPLSPTSDVSRVAHTSPEGWTDYRYERAGRTVYVVPAALTSVSVWLIPQTEAIEHTLMEAIPEINNEILEASAQALENRIAEAERIEQESLRETP